MAASSAPVKAFISLPWPNIYQHGFRGNFLPLFVVPRPKLMFMSTAVKESENQVISCAGIDSLLPIHLRALAREGLT
jgi:hypothetical protein